MKNAMQFRGHCQYCGREQAVKNGTMAHHGYTVEHGYFNGPCTGHNYQPIEKVRNDADTLIIGVRREAGDMDARIAALNLGTVKPETIKLGVSMRGKPDTKPFSEGTPYEQQREINRVVFLLERRAKQARDFADQLEVIVNTFHGKPLREVAAAEKPAPIRHGERRALEGGRVAKAVRVEGQRVVWLDNNGKRGWTGTQAWRKLTIIEAA